MTEVREVLRNALVEVEKQSGQFPAKEVLRRDKANYLANLSINLFTLNAPEDAERAARASLRIYEQLRHDHPESIADSYPQAICHERLGRLARDVPSKQTEFDAAIRFFTEAIAAVYPPQVQHLYRTHYRYNAACSAVLLAVCKQGPDAARLRGKAMSWLRIDLAGWQHMVETNSDSTITHPDDSWTGRVESRSSVGREMRYWQQDEDFASVRGAAALAKLPEPERQEWQKLWTDVEETWARAESKIPPQQDSPAK